jgi:hypothetical protein
MFAETGYLGMETPKPEPIKDPPPEEEEKADGLVQ